MFIITLMSTFQYWHCIDVLGDPALVLPDLHQLRSDGGARRRAGFRGSHGRLHEGKYHYVTFIQIADTKGKVGTAESSRTSNIC